VQTRLQAESVPHSPSAPGRLHLEETAGSWPQEHSLDQVERELIY